MKGDYKELEVWNKSMQLAASAYEVARLLPVEEKFALADQIRRSAVSIPSNIAEGYGRQSEKEFLQFLFIARGSTFELETQIGLCSIIHASDEKKITDTLNLIQETGKMITSLISFLKNKDNQ